MHCGKWSDKNMQNKLSMVVCICNPSTQEAEAGRWRVCSQTGLHNEALFQNKHKTTTASVCVCKRVTEHGSIRREKLALAS
jgi:hypothetical protein